VDNFDRHIFQKAKQKNAIMRTQEIHFHPPSLNLSKTTAIL